MPELDPEYLAGAAEGKLRIQRCAKCDRCRFPASPLCPACLRWEAEWVDASGRGELWSWIRMHKPYFASLDREVPYNVAMVRLAEGPMMISAIDGDDSRLACGTPLSVVFRSTGGVPLPWFRVAAAAGSVTDGQ
jgi:uncharacterized protein